jgi:AhpD family alkylhydroperoxidase
MAQPGEALGVGAALVFPPDHPQQRRTNMRKSTGILLTLGTALVLGVVTGFARIAAAQDNSAEATYREIEQTLGSVPTMFKAFPEAGIAAAWAEFKSLQLNPKTKLDGRMKELIGLAVSAQIPCQYCVYFHTAAAKANGATDAEIREAVAMAAVVRHWSTVLNGMQVDVATFKQETDAVLRAAGEKAKTANK